MFLQLVEVVALPVLFEAAGSLAPSEHFPGADETWCLWPTLDIHPFMAGNYVVVLVNISSWLFQPLLENVLLNCRVGLCRYSKLLKPAVKTA